MIKFHKVRFKNFLSTGNDFTEIDLSREKTTLVIGSNGAGKSTMLDALTFGLFGRAFRKIPKPLWLTQSIRNIQLLKLSSRLVEINIVLFDVLNQISLRYT